MIQRFIELLNAIRNNSIEADGWACSTSASSGAGYARRRAVGAADDNQCHGVGYQC